MIASTPIRIISVAVLALVVTVGVRAIGGGFGPGFDAFGEPSAGAGRGTRTVGVVIRVVDGDTVQVELRGGREVRVRLLGISAPEIRHPGKPGECYGQAAMWQLEQLLPAGTQVTLVSDPTQDDVDTYGRWLRYVQASGRDVGAAQIRSGSAQARDSSTPVSRHPKYAQMEGLARDADRGLWSAACR